MNETRLDEYDILCDDCGKIISDGILNPDNHLTTNEGETICLECDYKRHPVSPIKKSKLEVDYGNGIWRIIRQPGNEPVGLVVYDREKDRYIHSISYSSFNSSGEAIEDFIKRHG